MNTVATNDPGGTVAVVVLDPALDERRQLAALLDHVAEHGYRVGGVVRTAEGVRDATAMIQNGEAGVLLAGIPAVLGGAVQRARREVETGGGRVAYVRPQVGLGAVEVELVRRLARHGVSADRIAVLAEVPVELVRAVAGYLPTGRGAERVPRFGGGPEAPEGHQVDRRAGRREGRWSR